MTGTDAAGVAYHAGDRCRVCAAPITVHQRVRGGTCDAAHCRHTALSEALAARQRSEAEALRQQAAAWKQGAPGRVAKDAIVAVLPFNQAALGRSSKRRRRAILARLSRLLREAVARRDEATDRVEPSPVGSAEPAAPVPGQEHLFQACATCRGRCCRWGRDHAYLDAETVERFLRIHPGAGEDDLLRAYGRYFPQRSYVGSCVFHAAGGCTLPREMRSGTCNWYHCGGLAELRDRLSSGAAAVFAVATAAGKAQRAAYIDARGSASAVRRGRPR